IDDAIEDVRWIKEHGLRGGILLPNIAPDVKWVKPLYDPEYDRLWEVCQDLDVPVNVHRGTGNPAYGPYPTSMLLYINEVVFYTQRPFVQLVLAGVFQRFPRLRFVMTEAGCSWVPPMLQQLDRTIDMIRSGASGEIRYSKDQTVQLNATECFHQNVWMGVSNPGPADVAARHAIGIDKFMWGSDYPHDEGSHPYTREHLRARFHDVAPTEVRQMLSENAAALYDFDLEALAPLAARIGPTVSEVATPIEDVPEKELELISSDMDAQAIT
ncbi:MAG: amidohydrolase family protein, partial [Acidimicrobiales bacterium]